MILSDRDQRLICLWLAGWKTESIATEIGLSQTRVRFRAREVGLPLRKIRAVNLWPSIVAWARKGHSALEIAQALECTKPEVVASIGGAPDRSEKKRYPKVGEMTFKERASRLCTAARHRAKEEKIDFSLTPEWVLVRLLHGHCELTGLPFRVGTGRDGARNNFSPSIDRCTPRLGYTKENSRVVVWAYNAAKGAGSDDDVLLMASALVHREARDAQKRLAESDDHGIARRVS